MTIYEGSRYTNVYAYQEEHKGKTVMAFRNRSLTPIDNRESTQHTWIQSDRLDLLANQYYGETQYWWFILDANPMYMRESDIQNGDVLLIPPYSELRKIIVQVE